jgi:hypothetical protein
MNQDFGRVAKAVQIGQIAMQTEDRGNEEEGIEKCVQLYIDRI